MTCCASWDEVIAERGLDMFSYHPQLFASPVLQSLVEALPGV